MYIKYQATNKLGRTFFSSSLFLANVEYKYVGRCYIFVVPFPIYTHEILFLVQHIIRWQVYCCLHVYRLLKGAITRHVQAFLSTVRHLVQYLA